MNVVPYRSCTLLLRRGFGVGVSGTEDLLRKMQVGREESNGGVIWDEELWELVAERKIEWV
jgi:hypothetical protein